MIYGTVWTLDRYNKRLWSSMDIVLAVHSSSYGIFSSSLCSGLYLNIDYNILILFVSN